MVIGVSPEKLPVNLWEDKAQKVYQKRRRFINSKAERGSKYDKMVFAEDIKT